MARYHIVADLFWMAGGIFLMYFSCRLGTGNLYAPGPGLLPFLLGFLLLFLSIYKTIRRRMKRREPLPGTTEKEESPRALLMVLGLLLVYALLLEKIGYLIATFVFLYFLFRVMNLRRLFAVGYSFLAVAVTYLGFTWLGVRFPMGILRRFLG